MSKGFGKICKRSIRPKRTLADLKQAAIERWPHPKLSSMFKQVKEDAPFQMSEGELLVTAIARLADEGQDGAWRYLMTWGAENLSKNSYLAAMDLFCEVNKLDPITPEVLKGVN